MKLMLTKVGCNSTATHWEISSSESPYLMAVGSPFKGKPLFHEENYFFFKDRIFILDNFKVY